MKMLSQPDQSPCESCTTSVLVSLFSFFGHPGASVVQALPAATAETAEQDCLPSA